LLIRIFCEPKTDNVVIPEPTYGMYKVSSDINNVQTKEFLLTENFQINIEETINACDENTKIVFLCSPNNPTGNLLNKEDVLKLCKELKSIVVIDEAYIDFAEEGSLVNEVKNYKNLVVMRTFSKAWGLAGIRLGYSIANPEITSYLFKVKAPYNINSLTRFAVLRAIKNFDTKKQYVYSIIKERERLKHQLETLKGIKKVFHSDANFLLIKCENPKDVQKQLAEKGVIIRDRSSQPKLEGCLRISIGNEEENDILWEEIRKIL
jgi:histidinol-phosphate aminotransferase